MKRKVPTSVEPKGERLGVGVCFGFHEIVKEGTAGSSVDSDVACILTERDGRLARKGGNEVGGRRCSGQ